MSGRYFWLHLFPGTDEEMAWEMASQAGALPLYTVEEAGCIQMLLEASSPPNLESLGGLKEADPPAIDWNGQWEAHGVGFEEGHLKVILKEMSEIRLQPGPGFGDLSHPTTRMMLRLMESLAFGCHVCDVGSGSGILSLAASALGAKSIQGLDIDEEALEHGRKNAALNGMEISFCHPSRYKKPADGPLLILLNLIPAEQTEAWEMLPALHGAQGDYLVSGILSERKEESLALYSKRYGACKAVLEEDGWCAFHFLRN